MKRVAVGAAIGLSLVVAYMAPDNPLGGFFSCIFLVSGWLLFAFAQGVQK